MNILQLLVNYFVRNQGIMNTDLWENPADIWIEKNWLGCIYLKLHVYMLIDIGCGALAAHALGSRSWHQTEPARWGRQVNFCIVSPAGVGLGHTGETRCWLTACWLSAAFLSDQWSWQKGSADSLPQGWQNSSAAHLGAGRSCWCSSCRRLPTTWWCSCCRGCSRLTLLAEGFCWQLSTPERLAVLADEVCCTSWYCKKVGGAGRWDLLYLLVL